jgi:hypothetical protein
MAAGIVMVVAGCLVVVAGVLGWTGRLPRNGLVGLRIPATLRSDRAFRAGNRAAGPATTAGGIAAVASGFVAIAVPGPDVKGTVLIGALVLAALAVAGAIAGARAANKTGD